MQMLVQGWWFEEYLLRQKSPTSLKVTVRQLLAGAKLRDFAAAMRMEYRLTQHFMAGHDFYESCEPCHEPYHAESNCNRKVIFVYGQPAFVR